MGSLDCWGEGRLKLSLMNLLETSRRLIDFLGGWEERGLLIYASFKVLLELWCLIR